MYVQSLWQDNSLSPARMAHGREAMVSRSVCKNDIIFTLEEAMQVCTKSQLERADICLPFCCAVPLSDTLTSRVTSLVAVA